jgi:hypothetical protein
MAREKAAPVIVSQAAPAPVPVKPLELAPGEAVKVMPRAAVERMQMQAEEFPGCYVVEIKSGAKPRDGKVYTVRGPAELLAKLAGG